MSESDLLVRKKILNYFFEITPFGSLVIEKISKTFFFEPKGSFRKIFSRFQWQRGVSIDSILTKNHHEHFQKFAIWHYFSSTSRITLVMIHEQLFESIWNSTKNYTGMRLSDGHLARIPHVAALSQLKSLPRIPLYFAVDKIFIVVNRFEMGVYNAYGFCSFISKGEAFKNFEWPWERWAESNLVTWQYFECLKGLFKLTGWDND